MLISKYMRLNCQILSPISETSELNGMKNFSIQNRVLQRDRVLQRRVLEKYYCSRKGGGCALYLHSKVVPSHQISFSDNSNNMVAVYVESLHTIFAVVHRPPDSPDSDFSNCMDN